MLSKKKYYINFFIESLFIGFFIMITNSILGKSNSLSSTELFVNAYSFLPFGNILDNITSISIWMLPQIFLIYKLHDFISEDFKLRSTFIFTRTKNINGWIIKKFIVITIKVFIFFIIQGIIAIVISNIYRLNIDNIKYIFQVIILCSLYNIFILTLLNLISINHNQSFILIATLLLQTISILFIDASIYIGININKFIKFIPVYNSFIKLNENFSFKDIGTYSILFNCFYLMLLTYIVLRISIYNIKKSDLGDLSI